MRRSVAIIVFLFNCIVLPAQTFDTEFYPDTGRDESFERDESPIPDSDDHIFNSSSAGAPDPFGNFSRYRFKAVRYRQRGLDSRRQRVSVGVVELTDNLSSYPDYALISLLRRSGLAARRTPAMVAGSAHAGIGPLDNYLPRALGDGFYASLRASDAWSLAAIDIRHRRDEGRGWSHALSLGGEFGADGHILGVRSDGVAGTATVTKRWAGGASLTVFVAGGVSERGVRTAATREAFEMSGDIYYNPVWGWQEGAVRNSRVNRTGQIFTMAALEIPLDGDRTLSVTAAMRRNRGGRTRLAWYGASSPLPDYYRKMPSYFPEWDPVDRIADAWRDGDPTVSQVDWYALYYNNTLNGDGEPTYIVEEQVEQAHDLHLGLDVTRRIGGELTLSYGARFRVDRSRFFKVVDDLLGAERVPDIDQYVRDDPDGEYHTEAPNENDMQNPGRMAGRGERFGYDYAMGRLRPSLYGILHWNRPFFGLTVSGSLDHTRLRRTGFYEKQLFPGRESFGNSKAAGFTTASLGASARLNVATRHTLSLSALASSESPFAGDVFISPEQNNRMLSGLAPSGLYGAELSWAFAGEDVDLRVAGFVNASTGQTMIRQYYDDLSSTFADMVVRDVDKLSYGVEAGIEARFTRWLSLSLGGSAGRHRYNSEPQATVLSDATGEVISEGIVCYMSGLATGPPAVVAAAEISYSDRHYWRLSLTGEWMGRRHVEVNPLYHSSRVAGINPSPEIMNLFTSQERLPDAFTLGVSLSKGFVLKRGYLRMAGTVRNLLSSAIIHSGYEQMRIMRLGSGVERTLVPFPSKYLYSHPLTWSLTVSYRL